MAKYRITAPDGRTFEVTAPDNATQDQVLAYAKQQFAAQQKPQEKVPDPSEGELPLRPFGIDTGLNMPQGVSRFLAGAGKAYADVGRGVGQLARDAIETVSPPQRNLSNVVTGTKGTSIADTLGLPNRADIDEVKRLDAPLMNTGTGIAGNIAGNTAIAIPTAMMPGANTIAGGAAVGSGLGALQPVGTNDSRLTNAALGGATGAAVPAAIRAVKVAKAALVDPFTQAGREKIVGGALNRAAADAQQAVANMRANTGNTPGFQPTAGQASGDAGISSVERAARAIDPGGFGAVDEGQRAALVGALRDIAKTPEEMAAAEAAREGAVKPLYDTAKQAVVEADPTLESLMTRPSMQSAAERAARLALERGEVGATPAIATKTISSGLVDESGRPIISSVAAQPSTYTGKALHDLKMGLSDAIGSPAQGMQGAERAAAVDTQNAFLQWLENKIPAYGTARQTYAEMSKPINQMQIGQELYNRFVPALADNAAVPFKSRADALAQALRNGDDLARNVTGMKGITMSGVMEPEQMSLLNGIVKDAQMKAAAESAGRGVGSDTVQKMAMSNLIAEAGLPSWIQNVARVPGGWLKTAGDVLYTKNDDTMRHILADVLKNPEKAATAMEKAGVSPSKLAEYLRAGAQAPVTALPAVVNGLEQ
jgi:hypothetical protein